MRTLAIVIALATSAGATPPSKTLERAIKLYDKKDFLSAHIELYKVVSGETGDDAANKQRAEFFVGKTLFQIDQLVASQAWFDRIVQAGPQHTYYAATLKWYAAIAAKLPIEVPALAQYPLATFDDPSLQTVRDELLYRHALAATNKGDFAGATKALAKIDKAGADYVRSRVLLGFVQLRTTKTKEAIATFTAIPNAGDDDSDLAALALAQAHARAKAWDKSIATLATVRATARHGARAAWESSWARLEKAGRAPRALAAYATTPVLGPGAPEPAALPAILAFDHCPKQVATPDGLAGFRAAAPALARELTKLVAADADDDAAFLLRVLAIRSKPSQLSPRALALVRAVLDGPLVKRQLDFVAELQRELDLHTKLDAAYRTTMAAAEVVQELAVQQALAQATAGKLARTRLAVLETDIAGLAKLAATKVPLGGTDLTVVCP
jgi:tetratricopeptide (TPR) repeat protein